LMYRHFIVILYVVFSSQIASLFVFRKIIKTIFKLSVHKKLCF